ncbi:MAG: lytic transglycosylase domain-containing protein [Acidisphaera sp.]|nr:lytic transglycosylase domain-containing protein [Acidisphaera sp.]
MIRTVLRCALPLALAGLLAACAGRHGASTRAYEAERYAGRTYPAPGPPEDPWGPYVREAAARYQVPETWIREVMRQESGGRQYLGGGLTTSPAGAMGLMQVMPDTYEGLRQRHGLGPDPYDPHDNILAGTAYIREMYDRYGSPGFLAAYNAGPNRLDDYLGGGSSLPNETVNYLASVAPRLGNAVAPTGPLSVYASGGNDAAYAAPVTAYAAAAPAYTPAPAPMPSAAEEPGPIRAELADAPSPADLASYQSAVYQPAAPAPAYTPPLYPSRADAPPPYQPTYKALAAPPAPQPRFRLVATAAPVPDETDRGGLSRWGVQVGAYADPAQARAAAEGARSRAAGALDLGQVEVGPTTRADGMVLYRARLIGLSADAAAQACGRLSQSGVGCLMVPPAGAS